MSERTRRTFLFGGRGRADPLPFPPGVSAASIGQCSACGLCEQHCPQHIIVMDGGRPYVDLRRAECTFCGQCAAICPEAVFAPAPVRRFDHVFEISGNCLALNFVDCQACRDVCGEAAIRFQPKRGGPFQPVLDAERCSGCGACLSVCPAAALTPVPRAMEVANVC